MAKENSQHDFNIRHRLVGAVVLLGLGVIVIPMILQGKGPGAVMKSDSLTEEVQEWIVETEDATTYTSRVKPVGETGVAVDEPPELLEIDDASDNSAVINNQAAPESPPVTAVPDNQPQAVEPAPEPEPKPEKIQENSNQVAAIKLPEPAPMTDLKPENVARGWMVQVGSFSKPENAQNMISKLNEGGFDSRYEVITTDSGQVTRVWVGPYEKRVTAGRALEAVKDKTGVKGFIKSYP